MLRELHEELGIPADYGKSGGPPAFDEAGELVDVGPNLVGRMQRLAPAAAEKWLAMVEAAAGAGSVEVVLDNDGTLRRVPLLVDVGVGDNWDQAH